MGAKRPIRLVCINIKYRVDTLTWSRFRFDFNYCSKFKFCLNNCQYLKFSMDFFKWNLIKSQQVFRLFNYLNKHFLKFENWISHKYRFELYLIIFFGGIISEKVILKIDKIDNVFRLLSWTRRIRQTKINFS